MESWAIYFLNSKIGIDLVLCSHSMKGDQDVDDVYPEDYVELYYHTTLLYPIYSMSLSSILDSFVYNKNQKPVTEGITLYYRRVTTTRRKDKKSITNAG